MPSKASPKFTRDIKVDFLEFAKRRRETETPTDTADEVAPISAPTKKDKKADVRAVLDRVLKKKSPEIYESYKRNIAGRGALVASDYDNAFTEAEKKYGLPAGLLKNMARVESNFNPDAVSEVGAVGLMQFMPDTAKEYDIDPRDPAQAIDAAGQYMQKALKEFDNDIGKAVASYHAGIGGVKKHLAGDPKSGVGPKTKEYVKNVTGVSFDASNVYKTEEPEEVVKEEPIPALPPLSKLESGIYEDKDSGRIFSISPTGEFESYDPSADKWTPYVTPIKEQADNEAAPRRKNIKPPLYSEADGAEPKPIPNTEEIKNENSEPIIPFKPEYEKI